MPDHRPAMKGRMVMAGYETENERSQWLLWLLEFREYAADLSKGRLERPFPSKENPFCDELKNLHSNLNHLTWQAEQVADGDYSQRVTFLGKFSDSFNRMIDQLKEREESLKLEIEKQEEYAARLKGYNDAFFKLTRRCQEWIIVLNKETRRVIYCNKRTPPEGCSETGCRHCPYDIGIRGILAGDKRDGDEVWEYHNQETDRWYRVERFLLDWQGEAAHAYIIEELTHVRKKQRDLERMAYRDTLTGIFNRRYLTGYVERLLKEEKSFVFCYIDLDHLKMVNDRFGHSEGDGYLKLLVERIQAEIRKDDVFARIGGDEFAVVFPAASCKMIQERMEKAAEEMRRYLKENKPYRGGFSYGIVGCRPGEYAGYEEMLRAVDQKMYEYKNSHREV